MDIRVSKTEDETTSYIQILIGRIKGFEKLTQLLFSCSVIRWPMIGIIFDFFSCISVYAELFFRFRLFFVVFVFTQNYFFVSADLFSVFSLTQNYFFVSADFFHFFRLRRIIFSFPPNFFFSLSFTQTFILLIQTFFFKLFSLLFQTGFFFAF